MEPDGPPVNYGITAHHSSPLGSKGKAFNRAGILGFLGKKLWGASLMPLVLGRLSTLEGWVGNEWELEGYHAFREASLAKLSRAHSHSDLSSCTPNSSILAFQRGGQSCVSCLPAPCILLNWERLTDLPGHDHICVVHSCMSSL